MGDDSPTTDKTPPIPALVTAAPPPRPSGELPPAEVDSWVRGAMHQDRSPGTVLAIRHPLREHKVPRGLLEALEAQGYDVRTVETHPDRTTSVTAIRDALRDAAATDRPLDLLVISGDGSLDHHVLVAAFWAFYPDLVVHRRGAIDTSAITREDLATLPGPYRGTFCDPRTPDGSNLDPTDAVIREIWVLRQRLERLLRSGASIRRILRRADRPASDPLLRIAVLAALLPHRVTLRPHGFDLSGLARATREETFQGLYPYVRSIAMYPAGTAADNALYAGVPGWGYAQAARVLTRVPALDGLRAWWERRLVDRFLDYFQRGSVVVPARFSLVAFDGDWQIISSHAAGGPAAGHFFSADLTSKTRGLAGYLLRAPGVVLREGVFGSTIVRIRAFDNRGRLRSTTEGQIAEGLYTNRAFIAGVGSVPSTNPTSFAGQSSLVVVPPIFGRTDEGKRSFTLRGIATFAEAILKGVLGRVVHLVGLNVGTLAGGGRFAMAAPENQVTLKEGEELEIAYHTRDRKPRFVPTQVSGDPFQATRMTIRVAWGPIPLLAHFDSLLMASARRSLAHLRVEGTYRLRSVYIGGLRYFRHLVGSDWSATFCAETGLFAPPRHLPRRLAVAQRDLLRRWQALDTGVFVDTSERGLQLGRRGRYAHNNDQTAHLVLVRETRSTLLVRQVRATPPGDIYEGLTHYRAFGASYVIISSQTRLWRAGDNPQILQEEHYFRSAEAFRKEAPTFFPFFQSSPEEPTLPEVTEEVPL